MRYDLNILWVEDSSVYYEEAKEILETYAEDCGISLNFKHIFDVSVFFDIFDKNEKGFNLYDMYFIDYTLSSSIIGNKEQSSNILGNQIISFLRSKSIDSDILFYSSDKESEIKKIIEEDILSYEGVYIANKDSFDEKSFKLIRKNVKRLTSLSNIRGYIMDHTSENDFTIKSYIMSRFNNLSENQKKEISDLVLDYIKQRRNFLDTRVAEEINKLEEEGIKNIKNVMKYDSFLLPIRLKYIIFAKMIESDPEFTFEAEKVNSYLDHIVNMRNKLAHKKLDLCRTQEYILYYDTMKQLEERKCPENCSENTNDNKISIEQWNELRNEIRKFGKEINDIQTKMKEFMKVGV